MSTSEGGAFPPGRSLCAGQLARRQVWAPNASEMPCSRSHSLGPQVGHKALSLHTRVPVPRADHCLDAAGPPPCPEIIRNVMHPLFHVSLHLGCPPPRPCLLGIPALTNDLAMDQGGEGQPVPWAMGLQGLSPQLTGPSSSYFLSSQPRVAMPPPCTEALPPWASKAASQSPSQPQAAREPPGMSDPWYTEMRRLWVLLRLTYMLRSSAVGCWVHELPSVLQGLCL